MNDNHNERQLPPPIPAKLISNEWRNGKVRQASPPRPPLRAVKLKGDQLRAAVRNGSALDWSDLHERFVDLWQESRTVIWRAKHAKCGLKQTDPVTGQSVLTFVANDRLVLEAINTTRGVLDSLVKLRREMDRDTTGIPRWAIDRIERALRNYPEAMSKLLKELAAKGDKQTEVE
jgi:hypothetical protein